MIGNIGAFNRPWLSLTFMSNQLKLFCWVLDISHRPIAVNIARSETVSDLAKAIKIEMSPALENVVVDTLILWQVSIPGANIKYELGVHQFKDEESLSPMLKLSNVFVEDPPELHLHIVVRAPATEVRTFVRGTQKGGRVYHPSTSAGVPSATLTDTSPESVAADLDQNPGDVHPAGDLIDPTDAGTSNGQDLILSSDAPLPPSSPPPLEISFQNESMSSESNRSTRKRKQMAYAPPPNRSFSLESSPADSPFSTPQNSDMGGKRSRVTGPVVLSGIKEELSSFRSAYSSKTEMKLGMIKDIITRKTSADYRREARKLFQQLEPDLGDQATIHIMTLLQSDKNAEMYVDFTRDSLREAWVQEQINNTGLG